MPSRTPGDGRYSRFEREQRWLLNRVPDRLTDPIEITDHYLRDTHLRLRRVESAQEVHWKLGQKIRVRSESPEIVRLTNVYLSEQEYERLRRLDGAMLTKTRWKWVWGDRVVSVDVFHGHLDGLVLAEIELDIDEDLLGRPRGAVAEVTQDDRFSGGTLAWSHGEELERLLADVSGGAS